MLSRVGVQERMRTAVPMEHPVRPDIKVPAA